MQWRTPKGFEKNRSVLWGSLDGMVLAIRKHERRDGVWRESKDFQLFIDNRFVGTASTLQNAKLALILAAQETQEGKI